MVKCKTRSWSWACYKISSNRNTWPLSPVITYWSWHWQLALWFRLLCLCLWCRKEKTEKGTKNKRMDEGRKVGMPDWLKKQWMNGAVWSRLSWELGLMPAWVGAFVRHRITLVQFISLFNRQKLLTIFSVTCQLGYVFTYCAFLSRHIMINTCWVNYRTGFTFVFVVNKSKMALSHLNMYRNM